MQSGLLAQLALSLLALSLAGPVLAGPVLVGPAGPVGFAGPYPLPVLLA